MKKKKMSTEKIINHAMDTYQKQATILVNQYYYTKRYMKVDKFFSNLKDFQIQSDNNMANLEFKILPILFLLSENAIDRELTDYTAIRIDKKIIDELPSDNLIYADMKNLIKLMEIEKIVEIIEI